MMPPRRLISTLSLTAAAVAIAAPASAQSDSVSELRAVREEIRELEARLADRQVDRDAQTTALRAAEIRAADAAAALRNVRAELASQRARQEELDASASAAAQRLGSESGLLARQVRMSYATGRQEALRLLLNQENPARLGRMVVYYDYLNRARAARLDTVRADIVTLERLRAEGQVVEAELARLETAQAREVDALNAARDERQTALASIEADIAGTGAELERLQAQAERLEQVIAEIGFSPELFPPEFRDGFAAARGQLEWPVAGTVIDEFGDPRAGGQIRWNGFVIAAAAGTPVEAIFYGRVAYADWLTGLGLLIIVDHGAGFMSLYGHNEALLREPGDWVVPGEPIAHVGDTGGRQQTALYFEIRENGDPVDPRRWMAGQPD
ncbi:MAG TPA: peptidoglycan DD-metalloendopeptidase family protein [Gammaproteobacteria bacterium]